MTSKLDELRDALRFASDGMVFDGLAVVMERATGELYRYPDDPELNELSEHYGRTEEVYRRKGAYRRFKEWLDGIDKLDAWYAFDRAEEGIRLDDWANSEGG